jgi:hypothetical protein
MKATSTYSLNFRSLLVAMSISIAAVAVGCGGGGGGGTGGSGGGGTGGTACDVPQIFTKNFCDAGTAPAAGFDMQTAGWETHLVGKVPMSITPAPANGDTMCAGMNKVYLMAGSNPAAGLFIDKISKKKPGCGMPMPNLPGVELTPDQIACVQTWANALVAAAH